MSKEGHHHKKRKIDDRERKIVNACVNFTLGKEYIQEYLQPIDNLNIICGQSIYDAYHVR